MNTDIEDLLREAVAWQRDQAPGVPGLMEGARRRRSRRQMWLAASVAAATAAAVGAIVVPVLTLSGGKSSTAPAISSRKPIPSCSPATLAATFGQTGIGAGSARGVITLFNPTGRPCTLATDASVTPLDAAGTAIRTPTPLVAPAPSPPLILRGLAGGRESFTHGDVVGAAVAIGGVVQGPNGAVCSSAESVSPARWRVTVAGASLSVANKAPGRSAVPRLTACRAQFSAQPQEPAQVVLGTSRLLGPSPYVQGYGTVDPATLSLGGDPYGYLVEVKWTGWGDPFAYATAQGSVAKPKGGWYPKPVTVKLRATGLANCDGAIGYSVLYIQRPKRPGGPLGSWQRYPWGNNSICRTVPEFAH